jgi:hypothetical protein
MTMPTIPNGTYLLYYDDVIDNATTCIIASLAGGSRREGEFKVEFVFGLPWTKQLFWVVKWKDLQDVTTLEIW